ncbi:MAG: metallophosphatase family protein [Actinomycetota bacterium]|nr:metallophosphatase family protein [Actinomycetota bacterium]
MRVAVISDIHGNLHALEAVLAAIDGEGVDEIWCLGDLVGYGPEPNACCTLVAEHAEICLVGNHDLAVLGHLDLAEFSHDAATSARWTQGVLSDAARGYLDSLEPAGEREGTALYHASPRDPVWEYVLSADVAAASLAAAPHPIVLVGHSHIALALAAAVGALEGGLAPGDTELALDEAERWLLNPGSVGQPRDGDPRAAYLVLDFLHRRGFFRRVPYAVERTQAEIRDRGLPETLAARLEHGV